MSDGPKLYVNKPKKAQLKQFQEQFKGMDSQSSSSASSSTRTSTSSSTGSDYGGASKPPHVPKESFARRYKFLWPLVLTVNLAVGAYVFMRTNKKDTAIEDEPTDATPSTSSPAAAAATESLVASLPIVVQPLRVTEPIPAHQQKELFKWVLEEKRKIKTKDPEEKKRNDEEKDILKQFIRAKSIPSF